MSDHSSPEQLKKDLRVYKIIFVALLVGTVLTVWAATLPFNKQHPTVGIAVALIIASVKSFLVAGYFMHLISEKRMIYATLAATAFFFVSLMALTLWAMHDFPFQTLVNGK